ncbi:MAG: bifunctional (p)ppGpp synthetase/guanosine-3',5'-bis(diphosphate) 3'-pyrophosphohydrolase [Clostridia bacterium]|nr:bifunctional (p)ppGpp synthetase/guanosine-3',5'-bis(diphosphate) 3'-pyrophosphohydrolase [Clostridia bacterium]MBR2448708.1 bifunctional (p)ppGpp synthetase/guanosine-3',5'-bis(diphosphate) 3'-pyrophosphohydrolase [Clostridia bacterium]
MIEILTRLENTYNGKDYAMLKRAYDFARKAHVNQKRASGEEYFIHPCTVAGILIDLGLDAATVAAAFLHDVIEDTPVSEGDIKKEFGDEVLELVVGVTKLEKIQFHSKEEEQAENFRKIFVAMAKDIRVIIIKLADRLHNMRSLNFLSVERQQRMARETLEVYAPLAHRLGISQIKCELEDLCLKYLEPEFYEYLSTNIDERLKENVELVDHVVEEVKGILSESGVSGEVYGRKKHLYSIYRKMKERNKTLDQIYDLVAIRIIVNTVDECYEVFGKIHHKWKPVPGRIKDYIATPKPNMYRSLHTTVVTNYGKVFEIQIRTYEMNHAAEYGIAAHWKYKEKKKIADDLDTRLTWIREVMEWQGGLKDSKEFLNSLKGDIYSSEVLVFTPKGDVISLPKDATPLDFAYNIHSAVGNKCVGAKVNSKMVPLNTVLQVGDVVDIITSQSSKGPSWDWLKIVKSPSARVKIKQFFKREMKEENVKTGKIMLDAEAKHRGFTLSELLTDDAFLHIATRMSFNGQDEMFASIGYGAVSVNQVIVKLIDYHRKSQPQQEITKFFKTNKKSGSSVKVKGMAGLLVRFAGCCNPVPGDDIVGFISRGHGVTVHRRDCPNLKQADDDRLIEVSWTDQTDSVYNAGIKVVGNTQTEILTVVAAAVAQFKLEIVSTNGRTDVKSNQATVDFHIRLNSKEELNNLINKLRQDPKITDVFRTAN